MSSLRGQRVSRVELHYPSSGAWRAEVTLERGKLPAAGPAELRVADLATQGRILPGIGGLDGPDLPSVVVQGGAGWDAPLTQAGAYGAPGGVCLSTVLRDVAALAGEPYDAPAEALLPASYEWTESRRGAPRLIRSVLADLVIRGAIPTWRMAPNGRTRFDAWPSIGEAIRREQVTERDLASGVRMVGLLDRAAAFLPGATVEGATIRRVIFLDTGSALTAEVWSR